MHPMLRKATDAARQAGEAIRHYSNKVHKLDVQNKDHNDFVSEVDKQAEYIIVRALQRAYPDHAFLGEESGKTGSNSDYEWVIDPLDGTTNFLYGIPQYSVSIALKHKGRLAVGVVYDPLRDETFGAARGEGATLNGRRIRVSERTTMHNALLGTGVPFRANQNLDLYLQTMKALLPDTAGVRRPGSAALDLAYVACGRFDGFWEFGLNEWDMAAGVLLVQEAGGLISDMHGNNNHMITGDVVAANPKVFKEMIKRLHPVMQKA
ncbi:MAG TPA: inositol monophosphatase family protein [Candidatus Thiothrix moscowensis]|uniref:inositol monophosphatase family protein n=1 Tax=unclassified Thiothrix TaxID=2636184 RepID=UPI0025EB8C55|nr:MULTISPECIES: inositol monophosphatase family protein [unclassified Thiothrix]HRJ53524.1 inositol monophosphatase family protein [Candidatus Thiothrix moscowensis]HRJ93668.1 inositol monophosphatase family protein [Candidatus Thiothrix moscowensis]